MKLTIEFPRHAKRKVLTQRGRLRPEIARDIGLLIDGYYKAVSSYKSLIEDPNIPIKIEISER